MKSSGNVIFCKWFQTKPIAVNQTYQFSKGRRRPPAYGALISGNNNTALPIKPRGSNKSALKLMFSIAFDLHDICEYKRTKPKEGSTLTRRPDYGFSSHIGPAQLSGTWWTREMCLSHPRKTDHLKIKKHGKQFTDRQNHFSITYRDVFLFYFLPISLIAKEHWYPQYIWVAPRPGKSKSLTKRGTISSFCSVWPRRP